MMNLIGNPTRLLVGHAPVVERRGGDTVLACQRWHLFFEVFVKGLFKGK
jgi:hypothetical protein